MANRREYRPDEREHFRENPFRSHWGEERHDYERAPYEQSQRHENPEYYGEREQNTGFRRREQPDWRHNQGSWAPRDDYGRYRDERHYGQSNYGQSGEYRDRPYAGSGSFSGRGGFGREYEREHEPYREDRENYGATSMGTEWGAHEMRRHRVGSLTSSARESAQNLARQRYAREYPERISYAGRGPKGYKRSDERIREDVSEALTRSPDVDATNVEVMVNDGMVTLSGSVDDRHSKRVAEDVAQDVSGVRDVQNQLRIQSSASDTIINAENKGPGSETQRTQSSPLGLSAEAGSRR